MLQALMPYRVVILAPDGDVFRHRAWTFAGALEWAACYRPDWGRVSIFNRRGRWLASR